MSESRVALITGANRGNGFKIARQLAAHGYSSHARRARWSTGGAGGAGDTIRTMRSAAPLLAFVFAAAGQAPVPSGLDVSKMIVGDPIAVCDLDMSVLRGEVRRLSWSPDMQYIHVQTVEGDRAQRDYIVDLFTREVSLAYGEPEWAAAYWRRKSDIVAPGVPSLKLEMLRGARGERTRPAIQPANPGGQYQPPPRTSIDAYEPEFILRMAGEEIGRWLNEPPNRGETYAWGPDGSGALVFADRDGRLVLLDQARRKHMVRCPRGRPTGHASRTW